MLAQTCRIRFPHSALTLAALFALMAHAPLMAADTAANDAATPAESMQEDAQQLPAITVTARRSVEHAKDLPFTVTSLGGEELEERRLLSLQEMLWQVPGVELNDSGGETWTANVRIRGVGALQRASGEDTSVGLSIDGVPMLTSNISSLGFDLERVEVLKGPQGTMFGSNSEAGAINITTAKPTRTFEAHVRSEVGMDKQYLAEGVVSGPLSDTLSARLAVRGVGSDHWVDEFQTGQPLSTPRDNAVRGTLLWQPLATTNVTLSAQHDSLRNHPNAFLLQPYGKQPTMDRGLEYQPQLTSDSRKVDRVSAVVEHDFSAMKLTSVTGYSKGDTWMAAIPYEGHIYRHLLGMQPEGGGYYIMHNKEETTSQELRLSSLPGDPLFWVAGASWLRHQRHVDNPFGAFDQFYPDSTMNSNTWRYLETTSRAVFGEATVPVAERFKLTAGLRHTWDRKSYQASWQAMPGNGRPIRYAEDSDSLSENYTTGRVALAYKLSAQTNLYGIFSRGYKSRGYNDSGTNLMSGGRDLPYQAARVNNWEIGFKHERADGRLGLNAAVFQARSKGDHILVFDPVTFEGVTENLDTRSRGFEVSGFWKPSSNWLLDAALAYTDATITGVPAGSSSGALPGYRVPDSPKWSGNLAVQYRLPLASFLGWQSPALNTRLNLRFASNRAADPQNSFNMPGYHQLDLRTGISGRNTELYLWVKNLTDKQYDLGGYYYAPMYDGGPDARMGMPSRGRTVGIGFAYYF